MPTLNLTQANKLYWGNTEAQKLYKGNQQLYPLVNPDPYWDSVVFLLRGNNIVDISKTPKTIVNYNISVSNNYSKYGNSSLYFGATNSYLTVTHSDLALGTGPFTAEAWFYKPVFNTNDSLLSYGDGTRKPQIGFHGSNLSTPISILNLFSGKANQWLHIAYVRTHTSTGGALVYLNGLVVGSHTLADNLTQTQMNIGASSSLGLYNLDGYLQCFRLTKGIARYSSEFNPETDTYLAY